ncbi:MAG: SDR family NAD(P)-dependent oxidoreductase [Deltaproteobacteria bacterium]|nr:MAG: SDR family NAD(P)-dependent oxidoreductase [Deltaproteobacteria bacterium]
MSLPVAIVGLGLRLPGGVTSAEELVRFLEDGGDGIREVPSDRWSIDLHHSSVGDARGKVKTRFGGFLHQDLFSFDPAPFGISPREAEHLDPQQRLLLECTLEAFEDAGLSGESLRGSDTGVFVGGFTLDQLAQTRHPGNRQLVSQHTAVGATMTVLSSRLAYTWDLRGPTMTVDTACSASLVAVHLACQAIADGTCSRAIAGGANAMVNTSYSLIMSQGQFLSPDGRCKTFDASANGYGRGEGAGIVVLMPLADALRDGHHVHAVILGTGLNQDGRTPGMPVPSGEAQRRLAEQTCERAGVDPKLVGLVEAHGTGTRAGDPIEVSALSEVYGQAERPTPVGSIKSNIGHLEAAAGIAGLLKLTVGLSTGRMLPQRGPVRVNPDLALDGLEILQAPRTWQEGPRIAAINAFGYGGTNAHALVCDVDTATSLLPSLPARADTETPTLRSFPIEAACADSLRARARSLAESLAMGGDAQALASALWQRTGHHPLRAVIHADDLDGVRDGLRSISDELEDDAVIDGRARDARVVFLYSGMGPQHPDMGRELYATDPAFRAAVEEVDAYFQEEAGWSILAEMLRDPSESRMARNDIAQPANLVLQVGLTAALKARGLTPDAAVGHSVGEVASAWAAGCLTTRQAARVAYHRSQLQQLTAGQGGLLAIGLGAEAAAPWLDGDMEIAAFNSPDSVAIAGTDEALERLAARLAEAEIFHKRMRVEVAYHSSQMDPLEPGFHERLGDLVPAAPQIPLTSTVSGEAVDGAIHGAAYWFDNAREPVRLQRALEAVFAEGPCIVVEVGPHPVLTGLVRAVGRAADADVSAVSTLKREGPEDERLQRLLSEVYVSGGRVQVPCGRARMALPAYPFQRVPAWLESEASRQERLGRPDAHPMLSLRLASERPSWSLDPTSEGQAWCRDHVVDGQVVFPGAGWAELALAACAEVHGEEREHVLRDLSLDTALVVDLTEPTEVQAVLCEREVRLSSRRGEGPWTCHATARPVPDARYAAPDREDLDAWARIGTPMDVDAHYAALSARGLAYGPGFATLTELRVGEDEVVARVEVPSHRYWLHPALFDGALQALLALAPNDGGPWVPVHIARLRVRRPGLCVAWVRASVTWTDSGLDADLTLVDEHGEVVAEARGVRCKPVRRVDVADDLADLAYSESWQPMEGRATVGTWVLLGDAPSCEPALRTAMARLGGEVTDHAESPERVIVHLRSDDVATATTATWLAHVQHAARTWPDAPIVALTSGGQPSAGGYVDPVQAALTGLARVAMTEQPQWRLRLVDYEPGAAAGLILAAIGQELEEEVAVRDGELRARRIVRVSLSNEARREARRVQPVDAEPFEVVSARIGSLDALVGRPLARRAPAAGEVEVEVEAASLNFKDVMKALGMLSDRALEATYLGRGLGLEACGRVVRCGEGVTGFAPGDRVHAYYGGSLASHLNVDARFVSRTESADPLDAATWFVFATAWYGLVDVGRIRAGDRVLVHSAAGGVGLAAVQIAQAMGCEVVATAGTEAKRRFLRGLGISEVYDSRSLDFADRARPVDAVLSALTGEARQASVDLLRTGGRFIELGKQGLDAHGALGLAAFNRALTFSAVDLDRQAAADPALFGRVFAEVCRAFETGMLKPLPREVYDLSQLSTAFRSLASGELIGKVVLDFRKGAVRMAPGLSPKPLATEGTWLITGGNTGFGLATAGWLAEQGVRRLLLASRRGQVAAVDQVQIDAMRAHGAEVTSIALDVTDEQAVRARLDGVDDLVGIVHAAMVLDDRPLVDLTPASLDRVLRPKLTGAEVLHAATAERDLDAFVTFGSISALVGNPAQGAYSAANLALDALIAKRRAAGLAGTHVSWGALGDVGVVADDRGLAAHLRSLGLHPVPAPLALAGLGTALAEDHASLGIIDIDWKRWAEANPETPWKRLTEVNDAEDAGDGGPLAQLAARTAGAEDPEAVIVEVLREAAARVFGLDVDQLDPQRPLRDFGLDSIMAIELAESLESASGVVFPTLDLLAGRSLSGLSARVLDALGEVAAPAPAARPAPETPTEDLRAWVLERICVQEPYFDLDAVHEADGWLHAEAEPVASPEGELGAVGVAEAARHLAILGSAAARRQLDPNLGRVFFPVRGARLLALGTRDQAAGRVTLRARATEVDLVAGVAHAEAEMRTEDGALVARFLLEYHAMIEATFRDLFAAHAQDTEAVDEDPYASVAPLDIRFEGDSAVARPGPVSVAACAGHFDGLPAWPVSIMARDAVQLAVAVARRDQSAACVRVTGGSAHTERFVFAGESPVLRTERLDGGLRVVIEVDGQRCAWFDMVLSVEVASTQAA